MYALVLISEKYVGNGKYDRKTKILGEFKTRGLANKARKERLERCPKHIYPVYRVLSPKELQELKDEIAAERKENRMTGAQKAARTRKERGAAAYTLCRCGAKSKKLYSEMGGLETRLCQNGHRFEFDRWLHDRPLWRFC